MLIKLNWGQQPSQQHIFDFSAILCESKKYRRSVATSAPQKHLHRATSTEMILPIVSYYASFVFPCTGQHIIMCPTTMCLYYYYAFDSSMPLFFWTNAFAYCLYMSKKKKKKKIYTYFKKRAWTWASTTDPVGEAALLLWNCAKSPKSPLLAEQSGKKEKKSMKVKFLHGIYRYSNATKYTGTC